MAFVSPTSDDVLDLIGFESWDDAGFNEERADFWLPRATLLAKIATGCTHSPSRVDAPDEYLMYVTGVSEMVHYLLVGDDDREERMSPYSSERMGSYSYSKLAQMVGSGLGSGGAVPWFDSMVDLLAIWCAGHDPAISLDTEVVFDEPLPPLDEVVWGTSGRAGVV